MKFISKINIKSTEKVSKKFKKLLKKVKIGDRVSLTKIFYKKFKNEHDWLRKNVGCDWITLENQNDFEISSCEFLPIKFFSHIYNTIYEYDKNCILEIRFKHESNEPVGAFVFKDKCYVINDYDYYFDVDDATINKKIDYLIEVCYKELETDPNPIQ
jgi:hypothetical protein